MDPILLCVGGVILVGILAGAFFLVRIGLRSSQDEDPLAARMAEFADSGEAVTLEDVEMSQPFSERILIPFAQKMGEFALRFTPQAALEDTAKKIEMAGNPRGMDPTVFMAARFIVGIGLGVLLFVVFFIVKGSNPSMNPFAIRQIGIVVAASAFGFYVPGLMLQSKINSRQESIRKSLPDALDLLTICVEAGLGFDQAMQKVNEKWDDDLSIAFGRALQEIALGKTRRDALRSMDGRIGLSEMTSFIAAIIQSEQLGVSMAKVLRIQSDDMRIRRRQRAEEAAQKAPVKMLFPMAILIFPSIMIVLLGPAGLIMMQSALGDMFFGQ